VEAGHAPIVQSGFAAHDNWLRKIYLIERWEVLAERPIHIPHYLVNRRVERISSAWNTRRRT
uniref:hypothetical protein n=1 Tax=Burkholderia anthina TaxID=179879 RepID=UPI001ABB98C3